MLNDSYFVSGNILLRKQRFTDEGVDFITTPDANRVSYRLQVKHGSTKNGDRHLIGVSRTVAADPAIAGSQDVTNVTNFSISAPKGATVVSVLESIKALLTFIAVLDTSNGGPEVGPNVELLTKIILGEV